MIIKLYLESIDHPMPRFLAGILVGEFHNLLGEDEEDEMNGDSEECEEEVMKKA